MSSDPISNPDPESLDPDADRSEAEALGYMGLESGAAPWVLDSSYPPALRLHGIVRRVSHHDEVFTHRKRPWKMTSLAVEFPQLGQTVLVTMKAVDAVAFATPGSLVTFDAYPDLRLVSPGHLDLEERL